MYEDLKEIYEEKRNINMKDVKECASNSNLNVKLLDDGVTVLVNESDIEKIHTIVNGLMKNKSIKPSLIINTLPLLKDTCAINI